MLDVLKKVGELRRDVGGGKGNGLKPPKNLPDLARDIYEHDESKAAKADDNNTNNTGASIVPEKPTVKPPYEPSKYSIPKLDLSLIQKHLSASQSAVQSINPATIAPAATPSTLLSDTAPPVNTQPHNTQQFSQPMYQQYQQMPEQSSYNMWSQQMPSYHNAFPNITLTNAFNSNTPDDSIGFFKELEDYIQNNGLNNDVVWDLLNKNLLEHMTSYYTTRGDDTPFYASSSEISHAIKLKLEELQNLERNWIMNKQKVDLLKKLSSTLESDIHFRSEELKRLMSESAKRVSATRPADAKSVNVRSIDDGFIDTKPVDTRFADFFHIVKPRTTDSPRADESYRSNDYVLPSISSNISPNVTNVTDNSAVNNSASVSPPFSIPQKFPLNRYVTHDSSKYFYAKNGQVFKSLSELMDGIESMDKDTFNYHVNNTKNDFSNWIKGVFYDLRLSDVIRSLIDREKLWYYLKNNTAYV